MDMSTNLSTQIKSSTPLMAVVGATDLVVKKLREVNRDPHTAQAAAAERVDAVVAEMRDLQERAQAAAFDAFGQATELYSDLARRGESLVTRVSNQRATEDLLDQASTTVSQAKATRTTASKAARGTATQAKTARQTTTAQAKATRTTAKKAAKSTGTRAKATRTSARKTVSTAKKAVSDAANKTGR